ncbi:unnamed protein product [Chrysoparadoxa australica]
MEEPDVKAEPSSPCRRNSVEVSIPHNNLKVFAHAIQCLGKVGKELCVEAKPKELILRTLNDAKSAYAAFRFHDNGFFDSFKCEAGSSDDEEGKSVNCKILTKAVLNVFRTIRNVIQLVLQVEDMEGGSDVEPHLVLEMHCEHRIKKKHSFILQDCEAMDAAFEEQGSSLTCAPHRLGELLDLLKGEVEVSVCACHDVLCVRSYHHQKATEKDKQFLISELSIASTEFDVYDFGGPEEEEIHLVFSLKEARALLAFCEATGVERVHAYYSFGGAPIKLDAPTHTFEAQLIMATMEPAVFDVNPTPSQHIRTEKESELLEKQEQERQHQQKRARNRYEQPAPEDVGKGQGSEKEANGQAEDEGAMGSLREQEADRSQQGDPMNVSGTPETPEEGQAIKGHSLGSQGSSTSTVEDRQGQWKSPECASQEFEAPTNGSVGEEEEEQDEQDQQSEMPSEGPNSITLVLS